MSDLSEWQAHGPVHTIHLERAAWNLGALFPIYSRGQAYLAAQDGKEAATEFQKILNHPGLGLTELIAALPHDLGLPGPLPSKQEHNRTKRPQFFGLNRYPFTTTS